VYLTELSSGSVRVLLASGEGGDDTVVKGRPGTENGTEVATVGMLISSSSYFCVCKVF